MDFSLCPQFSSPRLLSIIYSCSQLPLIPMRGAAAVCAKTRRTGSRRWEAAAHYNGNKNNVVHSWRVRLFTAAATTTTRHFHKQTLFARFAFACLDSSAWPRLQPQQQQQPHSSISISACFSCSFSSGSGYGSGFYLRISVIIINTTSQPSSQAARQPGSHPVLVRNILVVDATPPHPNPPSPTSFTFISVVSPAQLCTKHIFHFRFHSGPENEASQAKPGRSRLPGKARQSKARQGKARLTVESSHTLRRIESSRVESLLLHYFSMLLDAFLSDGYVYVPCAPAHASSSCCCCRCCCCCSREFAAFYPSNMQHIHVRIHIHPYMCMHTQIYIQIYVHTCSVSLSLCLSVVVCVCVCVCLC